MIVRLYPWLIWLGLVLIGGTRRLTAGTPTIQGLPVLIVSAIAAGVRVTLVFVLGTDAGDEDLHMRQPWALIRQRPDRQQG